MLHEQFECPRDAVAGGGPHALLVRPCTPATHDQVCELASWAASGSRASGSIRYVTAVPERQLACATAAVQVRTQSIKPGVGTHAHVCGLISELNRLRVRILLGSADSKAHHSAECPKWGTLQCQARADDRPRRASHWPHRQRRQSNFARPDPGTLPPTRYGPWSRLSAARRTSDTLHGHAPTTHIASRVRHGNGIFSLLCQLVSCLFPGGGLLELNNFGVSGRESILPTSSHNNKLI